MPVQVIIRLTSHAEKSNIGVVIDVNGSRAER